MFAIIRRFHLLILLGLAIGVPYLLVSGSNTSFRDKLGGFFTAERSEPEPIEGIDDPEVNRLLATQQQLSEEFKAELRRRFG